MDGRRSRVNVMNQDQFTQAFIAALQNESVIDRLQSVLCANLKQEISTLRDEIKLKDEKIDSLEKRVDELTQTADNLEQYSRRNSLRIFGREENDHEDPAEQAFNIINKELKLDIKVIDRAHRVGKKSKERKTPRPTLVKFATHADRDAVYKKRRLLRGTSIFINEDLTQPRSALLYTARSYKRNKRIKDCWTHDGLILVKNNHGRVIAVRTERDLVDASK